MLYSILSRGSAAPYDLDMGGWRVCAKLNVLHGRNERL
jgi:hypothetical protein